ncbi:MAG TPA: PhnD/SsuA/transferrin family substrate-binding protein, partial [bacterium]|nr:PhnD/SsuA/transferrin family substrate-binding protein [bacterium]
LGYDPDKFFGQTVFAGSHPNVILAIYRGQVDGGTTFEDARTTVQRQFPDVLDKVKPIAWTDPIPNDTWSVSASLPPDLKAKIKDRLLRIAQTVEGKDALKGLYEIEGLAATVELTDAQVQQLGLQFRRTSPSASRGRAIRSPFPSGTGTSNPSAMLRGCWASTCKSWPGRTGQDACRRQSKEGATRALLLVSGSPVGKVCEPCRSKKGAARRGHPAV